MRTTSSPSARPALLATTPLEAGHSAEGFQLTAAALAAAPLAAAPLAMARAVGPLLVNPGTPGNDPLTGSSTADTLSGAAGNDTLLGLGGNDSLDGGTGNDSLDGGTGNDTLVGGTGNDIYVVDASGDLTTETSTLVSEIDTVISGVSRTLGANLENLTLSGSSSLNGTGNALNNKITGNSAFNVLTGSSGNDTLLALGGNDSLDGGAGNDALDGGTGNDILSGGTGNDTYTVDSLGDLISETNTLAAEIDGVVSSQTWTLGANLENLTLTGSSAIRGTGNALANTLTGNTGANTLTGDNGNDTLIGGAGNDSLNAGSGNDALDGGSGADTLVGGTGNDTYTVDSAGDVTTETSTVAAEIDTVLSSVTRTLTANIERLTLTGTDPIDGTGNTLANLITGNSGVNVLNGGDGNDTLNAGGGNDSLVGGNGSDSLSGEAGTDTMVGGSGNDIYTVDVTTDVITETSTLSFEIDSVTSAATYTLSENIENLTLTGTGNLNGTGNASNNVLTGNSGNNNLPAAGGDDTMAGGAGNDTLAGGAGNDRFDGGTGNDSMLGGTGNDTYIVDSAADTVVESTVTGATEVDTVISSVNWALGANFENLTLTGSAMLFASGNSLANILIGNGAANLISAGSGNDSVDGGGGNDTVLGSTGNDTLNGGGDADELDGGDGGDSLDGGLGIDTMEGGSGNDIYVVDALDDVTSETSTIASETDKVFSSVAHTLAANIENLALTGAAAINGTGNALNNVIEGNSGLNQLNGGEGNDTLFSSGGNDTMIGGAGDDDYYVSSGTDVVLEAQDNGIDSINTNLAAYVLIDLPGIDNLFNTGDGSVAFTGNALDNQLYGGAADDILNGAAGNDSMFGGGGSDRYTVNSTDDVVTETADAGVDAVDSFADIYTLSANIERLVYFGSGDFYGTGNALGNYLEGNPGNDTLEGGAGNDTMAGLSGNDRYVVSDAGDAVTEELDSGIDSVDVTLASYTLGANVENVTYFGPGDFVGVGNELANSINGQGGNDSLSGGEGVDTLVGSSGNDTLVGGLGADAFFGGSGNDVFDIDSVDDRPGESANSGIDLIVTTLTGYALADNFENLQFVGSGPFFGTGNSLDNVIRTDSGTGNDQLSGGGGADSLFGGSGNDTFRGGDGLDRMTGGSGVDRFIIDSFGTVALPKTTSDTITDFVSGLDKFGFIPSIGDTTINGSTTISSQVPFQWSGTNNELIVFTENSIDLAITSAAIYLSNTAAYSDIGGGIYYHFASNATILVAIDNGVDTALFRFEDTAPFQFGFGVAFLPPQLTLLATLEGTAATTTGDYFFTLS